MRRIWAMSTHASALSMDFFQSRARRRQRPREGANAQPWSLAAQLGEHPGRAIAVLNASAVDLAGDQVASQVSVMMWRLRPLIRLPA